jgi:hypothetical protein
LNYHAFPIVFQVDNQFLISQQDQPPTRRFASKSMSGAVRGEVSTVRVAQAAERGHGLNGECSAGDLAQRGTEAWLAVIAEADQALVEDSTAVQIANDFSNASRASI